MNTTTYEEIYEDYHWDDLLTERPKSKYSEYQHNYYINNKKIISAYKRFWYLKKKRNKV